MSNTTITIPHGVRKFYQGADRVLYISGFIQFCLKVESYRELIQENIGYEYLCQQYETYREDLDEIVELIVETVCAKRKTIRIAGSDFPHEIVRSRFLKLDNSHIEFVMDCLQKNTTEIRNMKQYLLTVLFNAPTTISNHYTSQVNHDLYGGW